MAKLRDRVLASAIALFVIAAPLLYQRYRLTTSKRLRAVVPGRFYRSGQMTATGFADAIRTLGIRTVINVQNEVPDPDLRRSFLDSRTVKEQELCRQLGVKYILLEPDLVPPSTVPPNRPKVIEPFLAIMDDPANYPILLHCKAGLHRTGVLVALYRMEYDGWGVSAAMTELKENGFGASAATSANEYIKQYILTYQPRSTFFPPSPGFAGEAQIDAAAGTGVRVWPSNPSSPSRPQHLTGSLPQSRERGEERSRQ